MAKVDPRRTKEVLERVERERGMARGWTRIMAERDPDMLEHLHDSVVHLLDRRDSLPRKTKEIIMVCLNSFQFYEFGVRAHTRAALKLGVTEDELFEAVEIVGLANLHGMTTMLPVLIEEFEAFKKGTAGGATGAKA